MNIISIRHICKSFGSLQVLRGIDLDIEEGEIVSIVGPSGAGKTTLLQVIGTLDSPDSGSICIAETDVTQLSSNALARFRNAHLGFIFQFHQLLPEFTAVENVMMPALIAGKPEHEARQRAIELLTYLGLEGRAEHKPAQLSGGESQRVAVARALMNKPKIIFADEPTGSLDTHNRTELQELFFRLRDELGQTFVIVTHDEQFAQSCDRCIHMLDGRIAQPTDAQPTGEDETDTLTDAAAIGEATDRSTLESSTRSDTVPFASANTAEAITTTAPHTGSDFPQTPTL